MGTVNIYSTQGNLSKAIDDVIALSSPYANLTYETRIENVLNYYQTINELVSIDYNAGGYLNYGLLNDGRFAVDIDNYQLRYTGTFGYSSSTVDKIEVTDLTTNINYTVEGALNFSGVPFFSNINSGSKITAIGSFSSNYEYVRISLDGTYSQNGNITGTLKGIGAGYIKSGVAYLEVLEGGTSILSRYDGVFDISPSGIFTKAFVGTISTISGDVIDSIWSENIAFPLNKKISAINLYESDDQFTLSGSKGSVVYAGAGNDLINGSSYSDSMYGESGNDTLKGNLGNDTLDGGAGTDSLIGGTGNDTYIVDLYKKTSTTLALQDTVTEGTSAGTDTLKLRLSSDQKLAAQTFTLAANLENLDASLTSTNKINLTGNSAANTLTGNAANNILNGSLGNDILTGAAGADYFDFTTALGSTNIDTITDFTRGSDKIRLENSVMKALQTKTGTLSQASYWESAGITKGHDADDRILYDTSSGKLYYDADGSGATKAVQIALIGTSTHVNLDYTDFLVI